MNPIILPLQPGDQGPADLEDALLLLVDKRVIQTQTAGDTERHQLS